MVIGSVSSIKPSISKNTASITNITPNVLTMNEKKEDCKNLPFLFYKFDFVICLTRASTSALLASLKRSNVPTR